MSVLGATAERVRIVGPGFILAFALGGAASTAAPRAAACEATVGTSPQSAPYRPSADAVLACVATQPLTGSLFSHWYAVALKSGGRSAPRHALLVRTMGFLLSGDWELGEAHERGIRLSDAAVRREFYRERRAGFANRRAFQRFLKTTGQTVGDLEYRVRLDMLSERIRTDAARRAGRRDPPASFLKAYTAKWKSRTSCLADYVVSECGSTVATTAP